jgi:hypothetical protein
MMPRGLFGSIGLMAVHSELPVWKLEHRGLASRNASEQAR